MAEIVFHNRYYNRHTYGVEIDGETIFVTVTSTTSVVRKWISSILFFYRNFGHRLVVGLGVQWTPSSPSGNSDPPADTLQLCVGSRCLIYQLAHASAVPRVLRDFLATPSHHFVGFWNHSDRRKLEISCHGLTMCRDPLDLRLCTETDDGESLARASVEEIVQERLGFAVEQRKEISMSDWDEEYLSEEQVLYACVDARCAFLIGKDCRVWNN